MKKETRGGRRPGAGRPPVCPKDKRVQLTITVAPLTRDYLQKQAKVKGLPVGRLVEQYVEEGIKQRPKL